MAQPRAELFAATINFHTAQIVRRVLNRFHETSGQVNR